MAGFEFVIPIGAFSAGVPAVAITVIPDKGFSKAVTPRVLVAQFGDGYSQRIEDGINSIGEKFNASFNKRPKVEIDNIVKWFESNKGVKPFDLLISDDSAGSVGGTKTISVIAVSWTQAYLFDNFYGCTVSLERDYTPVSWSAP